VLLPRVVCSLDARTAHPSGGWGLGSWGLQPASRKQQRKKVRAVLTLLFSSLPLDAGRAGPVLGFMLRSGSKLEVTSI
jgi:hypothetical protein